MTFKTRCQSNLEQQAFLGYNPTKRSSRENKMSEEKTAPVNHLKSLDGVKGIAACIIAFIWHYQHFGVSGPDQPFFKIIPWSYSYGYLMVEIFIMLSGFGMSVGYMDRILNKKTEFKSYFIKRIKKLYPLHLVALLAVTLLQAVYIAKNGVTFVYPNYDIYHFILNALCLQNGIFDNEWSFNSPSWCLTIMLLMYLVFYLVCSLAKNRTQVFVTFFALFCAGMGFLTYAISLPLINNSTSRGLVCFSVGVMLYFIYDSRERFENLPIGIASFSTLVILYITMRLGFMSALGNLQYIFMILIGPLVVLSVLFFKPLSFVLSLTPFSFLGKISMEIYLLHFPVQLFISVIRTCFNINMDFSRPVCLFLYMIILLPLAFGTNLLLRNIKSYKWIPYAVLSGVVFICIYTLYF